MKNRNQNKMKNNKKLLKTPNPKTYFWLLRSCSQVILPRFGLLFLVCDADLSVYRMLLTGGSSLWTHGEMHMIVPPDTPEEPSDLQPLCLSLCREMVICPAQAAPSQFPLFFFTFPPKDPKQIYYADLERLSLLFTMRLLFQEILKLFW